MTRKYWILALILFSSLLMAITFAPFAFGANGTISGRLLFPDGSPVPSPQGSVFLRSIPPGTTVQANTDFSGNYSANVPPGTYEITPLVHEGWRYFPPPRPEVTVLSGQTVTGVNLQLLSCTSDIVGEVKDPEGNLILNLTSAYLAEAHINSDVRNASSSRITGGRFSIPAISGSYQLFANSRNASTQYAPSVPVIATVSANQSASYVITLRKYDCWVEGNLIDATTGQPITNLKGLARIEALGPDGLTARQMINNPFGEYGFNATSGTWRFGIELPPTSDYMIAPGPIEDTQINLSPRSTTEYDLALVRLDSKIDGEVVNQSGSPVSGIDVTIQKLTQSSAGFSPVLRDKTDTGGHFEIGVPSGTYDVGAIVPPYMKTAGVINPQTQRVTLDNSTVTVSLTLRSSDSEISGNVSSLSGDPTPASVWGWSDDGSTSTTNAKPNGDYTLKVMNNSRWHIGARSEGTSTYEISQTHIIDVTTVAIDRDLTMAASFPISRPSSMSFNPGYPVTIMPDSRTSIYIPESTFSGTTVTFEAIPTAQIFDQAQIAPFGLGYDLTVKDERGTTISGSFSKTVTIMLSYTHAQLQALGIDESNLNGSKWDNDLNSWVEESDVTVDTTSNVISISTNHFTKFAATSRRQVEDTAIPSCSIKSPKSDGYMGPKTIITVSASDNVGIKNVTLKMDSSVISTLTGNRSWYTATYNTSHLANNSSHALKAKATDTNDNVSLEDSIDVKIDNQKPSLVLTKPSPNGYLGGSQNLVKGSSSDRFSGIDKVKLFIDNSYVTSSNNASYSFRLATARYSNGRHRISLVALDKANNDTGITRSAYIDNYKPRISRLSVSPRAISPGGRAYIKTVLKEAFSTSVRLRIKIYKESSIIWDSGLRTRSASQRGTQSTTVWNGKNNRGRRMARGSYLVKAFATDLAGNQQYRVASSRISIK